VVGAGLLAGLESRPIVDDGHQHTVVAILETDVDREAGDETCVPTSRTRIQDPLSSALHGDD
jgi:hypothetical protein